VASAANYEWLVTAESSPGSDDFCTQATTPCWDDNLSTNGTGEQNIGRVATMFLDVFDGQDAAGRTTCRPMRMPGSGRMTRAIWSSTRPPMDTATATWST